MKINLDENITNTFRPVVIKALNFDVNKIILKGGRSSFKSAVAVMIVIVGVIVNKVSALCLVKTDASSQDKLTNNIEKYMNLLGVRHRFKYVKTNSRYILLDKFGNETNHVIRLKGAKDTESVKSMTPDEVAGYGYTFIEEATLFKTEKDMNSLFSTAMRGMGKHCFICVYNPPMETSNYLNVLYSNKPCGIDLGYDVQFVEENVHDEILGYSYDYKVLIHHSTYLDAIRDGKAEWLGSAIIGEYEQQRKNNKRAWEWDKLGMVVGTDANVFWNIHDWTYTEDIHAYEICRGLDCSNGGPDPWAYGNWFYDKKNNDLYCLDEFILSGDASMEQVALNIKTKNTNNMNYYIDSAVPTFKRLLRNAGTNPLPAKKGRDSVMAGVIWLQSLNHIYIDQHRCPVTYKEFKEYTYFIDKNGDITSELVDKNNHTIDACRYALCMKIRYNN